MIVFAQSVHTESQQISLFPLKVVQRTQAAICTLFFGIFHACRLNALYCRYKIRVLTVNLTTYSVSFGSLDGCGSPQYKYLLNTNG